MAGHGSPPPEDKANNPARQVRKPWGEGGPHPSVTDEQVAANRERAFRNASWYRHNDPDTIEEGRRLNAEVDQYGEYRD